VNTFLSSYNFKKIKPSYFNLDSGVRKYAFR